MMKIALQKSMERVTLHMIMNYRRVILLERTIVVNMMKLWMMTSTLIKH